MTQFLLAAIRDIRLPFGDQPAGIQSAGTLERAAEHIFPNAAAVVNVAPTDDELGSVVDATREQMMDGRPFRPALSAKLLTQVAADYKESH